jgi:hypothetical protein
MLSAIISTHDSERSLVRTLAALFPGVTTGLLREVIVADGASTDATAEVADLAGCEFQSSAAPLGTRLAQAARGAKGPWLLFVPAGTVPDADWETAVETFITAPENSDRAATFRPNAETLADVVRAVMRLPTSAQGLLITRNRYDALGGHEASGDADARLMHKVRRRIAFLRARATRRDT